MVDSMLFADGLGDAGWIARVRVARIPPHALRTHAVRDDGVREAVDLLVYFYRFDAALKYWYKFRISVVQK